MNAQQWNNMTGPDRATVLENFDFSDMVASSPDNYRKTVHMWTHWQWQELPAIVRRTLERRDD